MRYLRLRKALQDFSVFSMHEILKVDSRFHRRRLNDWQDKGYLKKVIKGHYVFSDLPLDEKTLFEIANKIHQPSYVSFEMALSHYHLIPESTYTVTSASSRRPAQYDTEIGHFIYRKVKPELFFGYELIPNAGKWFKIASPEKAILDYFYLNPQLESPDDFEQLRIDPTVFAERTDKEKLVSYLHKFTQKRLTQRMNSFLSFVENA